MASFFSSLSSIGSFFGGLGRHPDDVLRDYAKKHGQKLSGDDFYSDEASGFEASETIHNSGSSFSQSASIQSSLRKPLSAMGSSISLVSDKSSHSLPARISRTLKSLSGSSLGSHLSTALSFSGPSSSTQNSLKALTPGSSQGMLSNLERQLNLTKPVLKSRLAEFIQTQGSKAIMNKGVTNAAQRFMGYVPHAVLEAVKDNRVKCALMALSFIALMVPKDEKFLRIANINLSADKTRKTYEIVIVTENSDKTTSEDSFSIEFQGGKPLKFALNTELKSDAFILDQSHHSNSSFKIDFVSGLFNVGSYSSKEYKAVYNIFINDPLPNRCIRNGEESYCIPISKEAVVRFIHRSTAEPEKANTCAADLSEESSKEWDQVSETLVDIEEPDYGDISDEGTIEQIIPLEPYKEGQKSIDHIIVRQIFF